MKLFRRNKKGFTLIELVVVIAIVGILATIVTLSVMAVVRNAKEKAAATALTAYWNNTVKSFHQVNRGLSTYNEPSEEFLAIRLGLDKGNLIVSESKCTSLPGTTFIYIQYTDNPKSVYNRYTVKCIWMLRDDQYYYTTDGNTIVGPKSSP